jgi:predicted peptidase
MKHLIVVGMTCALILLPQALQAQKDEWTKLLEKKTFTGSRGGSLPYRLLRPDPYDAKTSYPLVIFLHGSGERGTDNEKQIVHGVAEFAKDENRRKYPCFLVAPQCPEGKRWVEVDWGAESHSMPAEPSDPEALLLELIAALPKEFKIDGKRIYVTGLSMGGFGVWDLISRRPELFAAAVAVCGGGDETQAAKIAHIPIWAFHGAKDDVVKVARSRNMTEAIKKAGGRPKYTEYPEEGHASWVPAYRDAEMMQWLFEQKRK